MSSETDNVAILIEFPPMTDAEIMSLRDWLERELSKQRNLVPLEISKKRFNPDHGGVVIYQP